jgi:hypothetical protein
LSISDASILEGDDGTRSMVFVVRLRGPRVSPVKVIAKTADGTARAGSDYDALSTTVVFNALENQKTISVTVRGDLIREAAETLTVTLSGAVGAPLGDAVGVGTILDDDSLIVGVPDLRRPTRRRAGRADDADTALGAPTALARSEYRRPASMDDDLPALGALRRSREHLAVCVADALCGAGTAGYRRTCRRRGDLPPRRERRAGGAVRPA